jgi:hypothetical protein
MAQPWARQDLAHAPDFLRKRAMKKISISANRRRFLRGALTAAPAAALVVTTGSLSASAQEQAGNAPTNPSSSTRMNSRC